MLSSLWHAFAFEGRGDEIAAAACLARDSGEEERALILSYSHMVELGFLPLGPEI